MKNSLKMVGLGFFIFLMFFYTGWASCMIMVEVKQHLPIINHLILGIFSIIWGVVGLFKLIKLNINSNASH